MTPTELDPIFAISGAKPPDGVSFFEIPSRCSLYINISVGAQMFELAQPIAGESRAACCVISFKPAAEQGTSHEAVLGWIRVILADQMQQSGVAVRSSTKDDRLCVVAPWSMRHQFKSAIDEVLSCEAFRRAVSSLMADDFSADEETLRSIHEQSRTGIFASVASLFVRQERSWAFAHFNLTQRKLEVGYQWIVDMGADLHLMEAMEDLWQKHLQAGLLQRLDMRNAMSGAALDGAPTWIAQSLEIRSIDTTPKDIREFSNFLRAFVGTLYLQDVEEFMVTTPGQSRPASLSVALA